MKMDKKNISFNDTEIKKYKFQRHKSSILISNVDIDKMVISNKAPFSKKDLNTSFVTKILRNRLLCIFLPKMSAYRTEFDKTKSMSFLIKDEKLLEKYKEIWKKVSNIIKKKFDGKKYLGAKIKLYNRKINANFLNNKISIEGSQCNCLSVILIDSIYRKDKSYYPQVFLEKCKYVVKEKNRLSLLLTT